MSDSARLLFIAMLILTADVVQAELPSVRFDRLHPVGAVAGTGVDVEILGSDIEDVRTLLFDHPGLTAEFKEDRKFHIQVAEDVPAGTYDVYLSGRFGVSNPRLFCVDRGLIDQPETEPNNTAAEASTIALNTAINGQSDGNGEDFFAVMLTAGQRVTIDCFARRLQSQMDASLEVTGPSGNIVASNGDYYGADPFIDFVAPADGRHVIRINDLRFRGGYPYRLVISDRPHIETLHPRAIQSGQTAEVLLSGRNLGSQSEPGTLTGDGPTLDTLRVEVAASTAPATLGQYLFETHPTGHSVLPTAATCTLNGFQARGLPDSLTSLPILVTEHPVVVETESGNTSDLAQPIQMPAVIAGRFDQPRDSDWYEIEVAESGQYGFEVYSERIDGRADPFVVVMDDKENRVSELDDFGHRINAFDGHLRDPSGRVSLQSGRKYKVLVQDRYGRGGDRYLYVMEIRREQPDWYAAVIHRQNPGPAGTTLWKGGSINLDVIIHQRDGFNGPITITAEGLPDGVTMRPTVIHNNSRGSLVLTATKEAPDWTGFVTLTSTAEVNGQVLRREVRPYSRAWTDAGMNSSCPSRQLALAVRESAPFALRIEPERVMVKPGDAVSLTLQLIRHWPDFTSKVTVLPEALPGGFSMNNGEIATGASDTTIEIRIDNNRPPGDYTLTVIGQAQVPFSKDLAASSRPNTLVSLPAEPVTITVLPAQP